MLKKLVKTDFNNIKLEYIDIVLYEDCFIIFILFNFDSIIMLELNITYELKDDYIIYDIEYDNMYFDK